MKYILFKPTGVLLSPPLSYFLTASFFDSLVVEHRSTKSRSRSEKYLGDAYVSSVVETRCLSKLADFSWQKSLLTQGGWLVTPATDRF